MNGGLLDGGRLAQGNHATAQRNGPTSAPEDPDESRLCPLAAAGPLVNLFSNLPGHILSPVRCGDRSSFYHGTDVEIVDPEAMGTRMLVHT